MNNNSFFLPEEISQIGFKSVGKNVLISRKASFYSPFSISIGNNVRIDDFCILSGEIEIGDFIHIGAFSALFGKMGIEMKDFSGVSIRVTILSASDDFSGKFLTNSPVIDSQFCGTKGGKVTFGKHANVGTGSVILPGVTLAEGSVIGAMSLVNCDTKPWAIYFGSPCREINKRSKELLNLENELRKGP